MYRLSDFYPPIVALWMWWWTTPHTSNSTDANTLEPSKGDQHA